MNHDNHHRNKPFWISFIQYIILLSFILQIIYTPIHAYVSPNFIISKYHRDVYAIKKELSDTMSHHTNQNISKHSLSNTIVSEKIEYKKESNTKDAGKEVIATQVLFADLTNGYIGNSENNFLDDPMDNLFKINLDNKNRIKTAYLIYEVKGISNAGGVVKSINEQTSQGGFFINKSNEWITIKEQIDVKNLKSGKNTVLFTTPSLESISYQIKNVRFELTNNEINEITLQNKDGIFIVNENKTYIKGNIPNKYTVSQAYVNDQEINVIKNEFEGVINYDSQNFKKVAIKLIDISGKVIEKSIDVKDTVSSDFYFNHSELENKNIFHINDQPNYLDSNDTFLQVAENSVTQKTNVEVQPLRIKDIAPTSSEIVNVTNKNKGYRYLPDGLIFEKEVKLGIGYNKDLIPKGYTEKDLKIFFFDVEHKQWKSIPTDSIDTVKKQVISLTNHFTDYIAGIIKSPESPETNSFKPSSIQDIELANPAAGYNEIQMPEINQQGDASLSYPFEFPPSINGIKPNIGLQYNNNGGNGWLGLGWDLNIPSIEVETRWGVPVFDSQLETESYIMSGDELMLYQDFNNNYLPHRDQLLNRSNEARFVSPIEGSFSKVMRYGNSPEKYHWVVIDKEGNKYHYGSTSNSRLTTGQGTSGNIVRWMLDKIEDRNGNYTTYDYNLVNYTTGPFSGGKQLYIANIQYALNPVDDLYRSGSRGNFYNVSFIRKNYIDNPLYTVRKDASISNRFGFKEVTFDLLDRIIISPGIKSYDEGFTKEYHFYYSKGQFDKTLLDKVVNQHNYVDKPSIAYEHKFSYYNDIENGQLFEETEHFIRTANDYGGTFESLKIEPTLLGGGNGSFSSTNFGFALGAVLPVFPNSYLPFSKSLTLGATLTFSKSSNDTKIALIDINGDGLPDKVYKKGRSGKRLFYRKNLGNTFDFTEHPLPDGFDLGKTKTETSTKTGNANVLLINATYSKYESNSTTFKYLQDVNNDGLIDFIDNTNVFFTYIDPQTKHPVFTQDSSQTPNLILRENQMAPILDQLPDLSVKNDLMDIVKVWEAPISGTVNITGVISKEHVNLDNGIRYSIEHAKWDFSQSNYGRNTFFIKSPTLMIVGNEITDFNQISVSKGDQIFFRVASSQNPTEDLQVEWNPKVEYTTTNFNSANGHKKYSSSYDESFLLSESKEFKITKPGTYKLNWDTFSIDNSGLNSEISDNVFLRVTYYKYDTSGSNQQPVKRNPNNNSTNTIVYNTLIKIDQNNTISNPNLILNSVGVSENDPSTYRYIKVEIISDSEVNWSVFQNKFKPKITNTASNEVILLAPYMTNYPNSHTNYYHTNFLNNLTNRSIIINSNFTLAACPGGNCLDSYVYLVAKTPNGKIAKILNRPLKYRFKINQLGNITEKLQEDGNGNYVSPVGYTFNTTLQNIYFEMYAETKSMADRLAQYQANNNFINLSTGVPTKSLYSTALGADNTGLYKVNIFSKENLKGFGSMYRNWGQFAYKGSDPGQPMQKINLRHLRFVENVSSNSPEESIIPGGQSMESFFSDPNASRDAIISDETTLNMDFMNTLTNNESPFIYFVPFSVNMNKLAWQSHNKLFVTKLKISPFTRFEDDDTPLPQIPQNQNSTYGAIAIRKEINTKGESTNIGVSTIYASVVPTFSSGKTKYLNDFRDINGDGYPDVIGQKVQLTSPKGGLTNRFIDKNLNSESTYKGIGGMASGSPGSSKKEIIQVGGKPLKIMYLDTNGGPSTNIGADVFKNTDEESRVLIDINGDGLPDYIYKNGTIELNYGNYFQSLNNSNWSTNFANKTTAWNYGINAGLNGIPTGAILSNSDLSVGGSLAISENKVNDTYLDINGDGLVDKITNDNEIYFNTGSSFTNNSSSLPANQKSIGANGGLNGALTYSQSFPFFFGIGPKFSISLGGNIGENITLNRTSYIDFDGDGYLDLLTSDNDNHLNVRYSKINRTNMLKTVSRPLGAVITLDYSKKNQLSEESIGSTYKMPFKKWVLSSVEIFDGHVGDGEDIQKFVYEYKNGYKDRRKRKFLGFGETKAHQMNSENKVYRSFVKEYMINSIPDSHLYQKGHSPELRQYAFKSNLITREYMIDAHHRIHADKNFSYMFFSPNYDSNTVYNTLSGNNAQYSDTSTVLPLLVQVKNISSAFDENTNNGRHQQVMHINFDAYDEVGNLTSYREERDNINVKINYHKLNNLNYFTSPQSHEVWVGNALLRKSTTKLDDRGNVSSVYKYLDSATFSETNLYYNAYGSLIRHELPESELHNGDRMIYTYDYDPRFNNTITAVRNAHGYRSETQYNSLGLPTLVTDINSNEFHYQYDALGRLISFKGPYNTDWTIQNEYHNISGLKPFALTRHHLVNPISQISNSIVTTSTMIDGLGRVIQTKKQLQNENGCVGYNYAVSGKVYYDEFGRSKASYLSKNIKDCDASPNDVLDFLSNYTVLNHTDEEKTIVEYNYKDQPLFTKVIGLNALTEFEYGFDHDGFGNVNFFDKVKLPEGNTTYTFKDYKGRVTSTKQVGDGTLTTKYYYDELSQLTRVEDAENMFTEYTYDNFGQIINKTHPDSGNHNYFYNLSGKLTKEQNANLIQNNQEIIYKYNIDQLVSIEYPSHSVSFEYGDSGDEFNGAGRLIEQYDLTGSQKFKYGALGELLENRRTITGLYSDNLYFKTQFTYDSWGKIFEITYPDGERVFYQYNTVGQLINIKNEGGFVYLKDVEYNFFDQPTKITYGNGTINYNEYDITQRLKAHQVNSRGNGILMRNVYTYDRNQNITSVTNNHSLADQLQIGGIYEKNYKYDSFNRLGNAIGFWKGDRESHDYSLEMNYNRTHGIKTKNQEHTSNYGLNTEHTENSYVNEYLYEPNSHRVESINSQHHRYGTGSIHFNYDLNGNIVRLRSNLPLYPENREFKWDEQNRLMAVIDRQEFVSHYIYDASGERVLKREADLSSIQIDGQDLFNIINIENYTIYPSSYLVLNNGKYTKHYYINSKKFASSVFDTYRMDAFRRPFETESRSTGNRKSKKQENQSDNLDVAKLLTSNSQTETFSLNNTNQDNSNCASQISILLGSYYSTSNQSRLHCRTQILDLYNQYSNQPCVALEKINELTCIERDPNTGYPINSDGQIINPNTGYPIGQGPGENTEPDLEIPEEQISCYQLFQQYYSYNEYLYNQIYRTQEAYRGTDCFKHLDDYLRTNFTDGIIDYCKALVFIKEFNSNPYYNYDRCLLKPEESTIPTNPEPYNPGPVKIPGDVIKDDWKDTPIDDKEDEEEDNPGTNPVGGLPIWWYHTDHLGSSSYITDSFGRPSHYYDQLPFGESMVEHNQSSYYNNGYKFNGKELDEATGMYYYGARYYDPRISIFISVDPLAEQTMEPYLYVSNNPINMVDPTGMAPESPDCDGCKGFILAVIDNTIGTNFRNTYGTDSKSYRDGVQAGHNTSLVASAVLAVDGAINIGGGTAGLAGSGVLAITGVGAPVAGVTATGSGLTVLKGLTEVAVATHIGSTTVRNMNNDKNSSDNSRTLKDELPRNKDGTPKPDPEAGNRPHTQLGTKEGRKGNYKQAREFNNKKPVRDIDFTDHGRPQIHPNPHQHKYIENKTGGTLQRSKTAESL